MKSRFFPLKRRGLRNRNLRLQQPHRGICLIKKDFRLMLSARFFLLALGSLMLYSCYINFFYANLDDEMYPVYCYDPAGRMESTLLPVVNTGTPEELTAACKDGFSTGIDLSGEIPRIRMVSCGINSIDNLRAACAVSVLSSAGIGYTDQPTAVPAGMGYANQSSAAPAGMGYADQPSAAPAGMGYKDRPTASAVRIGDESRELKNRREITAEFLFFELAAVGFLGLAAMLFKEKDMGAIRIHAVLPVAKSAFILSKLLLILLSDLTFSALLTLVNVGIAEGLAVLPAVLVQAGILSLLMALVGFLCAVVLPDFKQFSLLYLVLAVFITTPVFLAGQVGMEIGWIKFHPMYHLFLAMKNAYFRIPNTGIPYYAACAAAVFLLFLLAGWGLRREMAREG